MYFLHSFTQRCDLHHCLERFWVTPKRVGKDSLQLTQYSSMIVTIRDEVDLHPVLERDDLLHCTIYY